MQQTQEKIAIVFVSGGLDSLTCLGVAKNSGYRCLGLTFDYGQPNASELDAAKEMGDIYCDLGHAIVPVELNIPNSLTQMNHGLALNDFKSIPNTPSAYVPARNTIFFAYAMGYAEQISAQAIFAGGNKDDRDHFIDCRPEYYAAIQQIADLATQSAVVGHKVKIIAPLVELDKRQIILLGQKLGLDYGMTVSCYQADNAGRACGKCQACGIRSQGFQAAGLPDPTQYIS